MTAANTLYVVEGGDHSLLVTKTQLKASGKTQAEVDQGILREIRQFVADCALQQQPRISTSPESSSRI